MSISGVSRARLVRMHDVMAGYVERGEVPGLVTVVSRRGEVHVNLMGTQAFGESAPVRRDSTFRLSSLTKPIIDQGNGWARVSSCVPHERGAGEPSLLGSASRWSGLFARNLCLPSYCEISNSMFVSQSNAWAGG